MPRTRAEQEQLATMLEDLFGGSAENLVRSLLGNDLIDPDEISRLRALLVREEKRRRSTE